jgi:hypothetical protein
MSQLLQGRFVPLRAQRDQRVDDGDADIGIRVAGQRCDRPRRLAAPHLRKRIDERSPKADVPRGQLVLEDDGEPVFVNLLERDQARSPNARMRVDEHGEERLRRARMTDGSERPARRPAHGPRPITQHRREDVEVERWSRGAERRDRLCTNIGVAVAQERFDETSLEPVRMRRERPPHSWRRVEHGRLEPSAARVRGRQRFDRGRPHPRVCIREQRREGGLWAPGPQSSERLGGQATHTCDRIGERRDQRACRAGCTKLPQCQRRRQPPAERSVVEPGARNVNRRIVAERLQRLRVCGHQPEIGVEEPLAQDRGLAGVPEPSEPAKRRASDIQRRIADGLEELGARGAVFAKGADASKPRRGIAPARRHRGRHARIRPAGDASVHGGSPPPGSGTRRPAPRGTRRISSAAARARR